MQSSIWLVVSVLALPSSATLVRGQDVTLGDVVRALQIGAQRGKLDSINPAARQILDLAAATLTEERVLGLSVTNVGKALNVDPGASVPKISLGVVNRNSTGARTIAFRRAVINLQLLGNVEIREAMTSAGVPRDTITAVLAPHRALIAAIRAAAQARVERALSNFERKYGPDSPELNFVEVGLNYVAQFAPLFKTGELTGPSPLEVVASYTSLNVKSNGTTKSTTTLSTGRVGLRYYFFGGDWGQGSGVARYLKPSNMSLGLLAVGPNDASLRRVWGDGSRVGPFFGWGDYFVGYVVGQNRGAVVGTQKFIIPRVF